MEYTAAGDAAGRAEPHVHHHGSQHCHVRPRARLHHVRQPTLPAQHYRKRVPRPSQFPPPAVMKEKYDTTFITY